jgi:hypothetical protein
MNTLILVMCMELFGAQVNTQTTVSERRVEFHHLQVLEDDGRLVIASFASRHKPLGESESADLLAEVHLLVIGPEGMQRHTYLDTRIPFRSGEWRWERQGSAVTITQFDGKTEVWTARLDPLTGFREGQSKLSTSPKTPIRAHLKPPEGYGFVYPNQIDVEATGGSKLKLRIRFLNQAGFPSSKDVARITTIDETGKSRMFVVTATGEIVRQ